MTPVASKIMEESALMPEGSAIRAKGLLHLGARAAVDQALSRLHRSGALLKVGRGIYIRPVESRFGTRSPSPSRVVEALAEATGEKIAQHGAAAANAFGLTTQVPVRPIYLTSGPSRRLRIGKQQVELRHAPDWQLVLIGRPAGEAVRALSWIGQKSRTRAVQQIGERLTLAERHALQAVRPQLPGWMALEVSVLYANA